jgi:hypothetical protein
LERRELMSVAFEPAGDSAALRRGAAGADLIAIGAPHSNATTSTARPNHRVMKISAAAA